MKALKFKVLILLMIAGQLNGMVYSQEYINDVFWQWTNAGVEGDPNIWVSGTQDIECIDSSTRTFGFENCIINNLDATDASVCSPGNILIKNSDKGILTLPVLPNIGKIIIARQGKAPEKLARLHLELLSETGSWMEIEEDSIEATEGCEVYNFHFRTEDSVQVRFRLSGNSGTRMYWLYAEGLEEGSREPFIPVIEEPIPDESKVVLFPCKADSIAFETLVGNCSYGWDPVNRGIYINWHRQFTDRINNTSGGDYEVRGSDTRHDSQNDIRALQHYYWFKRMHDDVDYFDRAIKRILPTVKSKFAQTSSVKGWMYYVLLRIWEYTDDPAEKDFWEKSMIYMCNNIYQLIDPELGIYYQTDMGNADVGSQTIYLDTAYRVGHQVQAGAALVDAGTRFNKPEWIAAGYRQVQVTYGQAFAQDYGLFGRIFLLGDSGYKKNSDGSRTYYDYSSFTNKLWDGQCKLGECSETIDALLRAANITTDPEIKASFLEIAGKMLNALRDQPIHDKTFGGFYKVMYVAVSGEGGMPGDLSDSRKEMRQASLLGTYNLANRIIGPYWKDMEREMYYLLVNTKTENPGGMFLPNLENQPDTLNGYRTTTAGFSYQLANDWSIYSGDVSENWVSNESNSLILLGLFEFLEAKYLEGYDDSHITNIEYRTGNKERNELLIFPNPVKENLYLESTFNKAAKLIAIYNLRGELVYSNIAIESPINVSNLKAGMYFIMAKMANDMLIKSKFVKID